MFPTSVGCGYSFYFQAAGIYPASLKRATVRNFFYDAVIKLNSNVKEGTNPPFRIVSNHLVLYTFIYYILFNYAIIIWLVSDI
jgi:hypothetical protein